MRKNSLKAKAVLAAAVLAAAVIVGAGCAPAPDGGASQGVPSAASDEVVTVGGASNPAASPGSADGSQGAFSKTEVVYANLGAEGAVENVMVVNRFDVERPVAIRDFGAYSSCVNLTNQQALQADDSSAIDFESDEGVFFYQGNLGAAQLPWDVRVEYALDGCSMDPRLMVGMSGQVEVRLTTIRNPQVNPAFADSFMQQITFTLPTDTWRDVRAAGATVASAGKDQTVAFTVLPGKDGDVALSAAVTNFSMGQVTIAALPYASMVEMPDMGDVEEEMSTLTDAITQLDEGAQALVGGADDLSAGTRELQLGAAGLENGLAQVGGSSASLVQASGQIEEALQAVADGMAGADFSALEQLGQLADQLDLLVGGLDQLAAALFQVGEGLRAALEAMDAAAAGADTGLTQQQVEALAASPNLSDDERATAQKLAQSWGALQMMAGTYSQVRPAFEGALALVDGLAADAQEQGSLASMAAGLKQAAAALREGADPAAMEPLANLAEGMQQLSAQYGQFHAGLRAYADGVTALADGASTLSAGAASLSEGTVTYTLGAQEFGSGMGQLAGETATLPQQMRQRMDEAMADYEFPEFEPVSFVDERNTAVEAVQFIMTLAAVEVPDEPEAPTDEAPEPSVWDRFMALFA